MIVQRAASVESSAWKADLPCKQQSYYSEEDGEDEQHVGGANHRVVGQLVGLAPHLVDIEAYGEDERRHAEQDHCGDGGREKNVSSLSYSTGISYNTR